MDIDPNLIERTKGFLDDDEGRCLYDTALAASQMGPCLEIGSYCGKSTLYLGAACKQRDSILFAVDHHLGSEEQQPGEEYFDPALFDPLTFHHDSLRQFRQTIRDAKLIETVVPVVALSTVAARKWATPLSLVFIDGGHAYDTVLADYQAWAGHVMPGGFLLIHDIFADPADGGQAPYRVYNQALASKNFQPLPMCKSLGILQRNT